ncbi:MAG: hypothetical protein EA341_11320 [Mongoliibacter sp.]|uniref:hypothetical protein n=1 Tax=Mongoliibacter sp. TaxID=2022438 RepID=UPI0012F000D1|nr:hypothetical protein [Mongoliibacter sp.]TVP48304.1 MAG: hypothetical protein EA341_11320 [Mongoliibacter sp.]
MPQASPDTFSPEMIRIFKIFGFGSLFFVFVLSFFNEKRANNTGEMDSIMYVADPERIYFKNLRASHYDIEGRNDAKMNLYRHGKREKSDSQPHLNFMILLNRVKNEAYIYAEPFPESLPLKIKWINSDSGESGELEFQGGNKFAHFEFAEQIYPKLIENTYFEMWHNEDWVPILTEGPERDAVKVTLVDFYRLINNPK